MAAADKLKRAGSEKRVDQETISRLILKDQTLSGSGQPFLVGIDIGSTTAKTIVVDTNGTLCFTDYRRHDTRIRETMDAVFKMVLQQFGDIMIRLTITGSAGMGICEQFNIPFVQEVVASGEMAQIQYPDIRTLIDIGGEDSKLIFFDGQGRFDIRMNGSCAGGTGAFIDQMAVLLGIGCEAFNALAEQSGQIYPVASRCGVFAKTDVQALMSRGVSSQDIAASVFNAVAVQTLTTLSRGFKPRPRIVFTGGPLTFMPRLRHILAEKMGLAEADIIVPERPELFPAMGAALSSRSHTSEISISQFLALMSQDLPVSHTVTNRDPGLFEDDKAFRQWQKNRFTTVERIDLKELDGKDVFVGIDAGSTTTKMVLIDGYGRIALEHYAYNRGDHIAAVSDGLNSFAHTIRQMGLKAHIRGAAVTGYGEDLIRTAFELDMGIVETLAHFRAARQVAGDASFILDIGGQDMKAMFIDKGVMKRIEINEACSSGCGTFLQTFAQILNCSVENFSDQACASLSPCDLGSRCTVFMNSRVKQSLRQGAQLKDMAAGLAYSVVRNCLNKVLKIKDVDELGENIVVQGGTFLNPSVHRAFEKIIGRRVCCPDIAGLMGAFGCALTAKDMFYQERLPCRKAGCLTEMGHQKDYQKTSITCRGCSNQCIVNRLQFDRSRIFYTGNRCEQVFSNGGQPVRKGFNLAHYKADLLFNRKREPSGPPKMSIGIPRALNMYENFPFWCTLFVELGMAVTLSSPSNTSQYEKAAPTIMSDNICFPAKLVHGHVMELIEKKVDRIFYPIVIYEHGEQQGFNSYNCPIVTGYPEVIRSAVNPEGEYGIAFDTPPFTFKDIRLFKKSCMQYVKRLGVSRRQFSRAFSKAMDAQAGFKQALREKAGEVVATACREGRQVIMVVGRPYHLDRFVNHDVMEMLSQMGMDTITAESAPHIGRLDDIQVLTQWAYANRLYNAAQYTLAEKNIEMVQLNSFGCGLDAIATDELTDIMRHAGRHITVVKIDDIASPGSIRLRLRTLVESMKFKPFSNGTDADERKRLPLFRDQDRGKKILVPFFSKFYSPFVKSMSESTGYHFEMLAPPDDESLEIGLKYTNNEICYPAIIIVGDILKALESGRYDLSTIAVGITQTGAQCRASNYVALIKKALLAAGYNLPVITVHFKNSILNEQPGFHFSKMELLRTGLYSLVFADALSLMYHSLLVRETIKGSTWHLVDKYMDLWLSTPGKNSDKTLCLLEKAVVDFNRLRVNDGVFPRIGIVGEIYAKYNDFCNHHVVEWLTQNNVEVELPCLINFFSQGFINFRVNMDKEIERKSLLRPLSCFAENRVHHYIGKVDDILKSFKFYKPFPDIRDLARKGAKVVDLTIQFGEGWLIPGEIIKMAEDGVENILCLQPFGCIANQVVAKGVEKKIKELYPHLNMLFVDLDANTCQANMFNRLHFLVKNARVSQKLKEQMPAP